MIARDSSCRKDLLWDLQHGLDGPAMVRSIREQRPDIPVLFMSGYAEENLRKDIDIPNMHFIPKPFSVAAISDKVAAVLRATQAG